MIKLCLVLVILLVLLDNLIICYARRLILSFAAKPRNRKNAKCISLNQKLLEIITLSYIEPLVNNHTKEFKRFYAVYVVELLTLIPQYIAILICILVFGGEVRFVFYALCVIKGVLFVVFRAQFDANRISKYER